MQPGDLLIYPAKIDKQIHMDRVTGKYQHNPQLAQAYPHQLTAEWLSAFSRTRFSQGALYETGSAIGLFQVKNYAEEFLAVLEGKAPPTSVPASQICAVPSSLQDKMRLSSSFQAAPQIDESPWLRRSRSAPQAVDLAAHYRPMNRPHRRNGRLLVLLCYGDSLTTGSMNGRFHRRSLTKSR